jgi:membrane associated rhomboid family serine protease
MPNTSIVGLLLVIANFIISYKGFTNQAFFDGYKFQVDSILVKKDYVRLISSGFLHGNWLHLIFNMYSLYAFSDVLEMHFGPAKFLAIYFASLIGGDLLSLFIHRNHGDYSAIGASGAVCGVIFAYIAAFPGSHILFLGFISIPNWLYGLAYVLFSIYGIKANKGNIGHDAHLGGALVGLLVALLFEPSLFMQNYLTILIISIPCIAYIFYIVKRPEHIIIDPFKKDADTKTYSIDHKYNLEKNKQEREVDRILDKINDRGIESLTKKEKEHLKRFS